MVDVPEAEDLMCLKQDSQAASPCHMGHSEQWSLPLFKTNAERSLKHTKSLLAKENGNITQRDIETEANVLYMHSDPPVVCSFLFVGIHSLIALLAMFRLKRMRLFLLGSVKCCKNG